MNGLGGSCCEQWWRLGLKVRLLGDWGRGFHFEEILCPVLRHHTA
jgi:hypothetical protein